jgi:hypothetical protein
MATLQRRKRLPGGTVVDVTSGGLPIARWRTACARLIVWETGVTIGAAFGYQQTQGASEWGE